MLKALKILIPVLLIISSCNKDSTDATTLTGKWKLVKYHHFTAHKTEIEPKDIARSIVLDFNDDGINGTMSGFTVSNTVSGVYELQNGGKMKTISFGGTKVGEPNWGNKFWIAIYGASSFERKGNKLYINYNADQEQMEFESQQ